MNNEQNQFDEALRGLYRSTERHEALGENIMQQVAAASAPGATAQRRGWVAGLTAAAAAVIAVAGLCWLCSIPSRDGYANRNELNSKPIGPDAEHRNVVVLQLPGSGAEASSLRLIDVKVGAEMVALGTIGDSHRSQQGPLIELNIDRVLKGPPGEGRVLGKDELPSFSCHPNARGPKASSLFKTGTEVVIYLDKNRAGEWCLIALDRRTTRFVDLYEIAQGVQPVEKLRGLLSTKAGGVDEDAQFILRAFPHPRTTPVLLEIVRETLESIKALPADQKLQGDTLRRQQDLVYYRLHPLGEVFRERHDPRALDAVLDCLEQLNDDGWSHRRVSLLRHLSSQYWVGAGADRFARAQRLLIDAIEGLGAARVPEGHSAFRKHQGTIAAVLRSLAYLADSEAVDALLREQARRPITHNHALIADALETIAGRTRVTEDRLRILQAWKQIRREFESVDMNPVERGFIKSVLVRLSKIPSREAVDALLRRLAVRPVTAQHESTAWALRGAAQRVDAKELQRIKKGLLQAFLELQSTEGGRGARDGFFQCLIWLLGDSGDSECVDALLREQAKRPVKWYHQHIAYALGEPPKRFEESDRRRIELAWKQAWTERNPARDEGYVFDFYRVVGRQLGQVADAETIDMLLRDQMKHPITPYHPVIVDALCNALYKLAPTIPQTERLRIKQAWIQTLLEFQPTDNAHERSFIEAILLALKGQLDDRELAALRALRDRQPKGWFYDRLKRSLGE